MSEHNKNSQQLIDEITRIRRRMGDLNRMHHRNIQEQLELAMCKMMEFLNEKPQHIEEYIKNLRSISTDDIGQALLDNMLEQIKQIKAELNSTIELPDDDPITVLDDANKILSKNCLLLNLVNRLQIMETMLHTHVDDPSKEEN